MQFSLSSINKMGYTTEFSGSISITSINEDTDMVDIDTATLVNNLSESRRMKRDSTKLAERLEINYEECIKKYGEEAEFYCDMEHIYGDHKDKSIIDGNLPPNSQPGLWLQWEIVQGDNSSTLEWNGGEKFYHYTGWLKYLINRVFTPRGYTLNGDILYLGEDISDAGIINVRDNTVTELQPTPYHKVAFEQTYSYYDEEELEKYCPYLSEEIGNNNN